MTRAEINELMLLAQRGDATAQAELANAYYIGNGVEKNIPLAKSWYEVAAYNGNKKAQYFMRSHPTYDDSLRISIGIDVERLTSDENPSGDPLALCKPYIKKKIKQQQKMLREQEHDVCWEACKKMRMYSLYLDKFHFGWYFKDAKRLIIWQRCIAVLIFLCALASAIAITIAICN